MRSPRAAFSLAFAGFAVVSLGVKANDMARRAVPDIGYWHDHAAQALAAQGFTTSDAGSNWAIMAERSTCRMILHAQPIPDADRAQRVEHRDQPVLRYRYRDHWSDHYPRLAVLAGTIASSAWQKIAPSAPIPIAVLVSANPDCPLDAINVGPQEVVNRLPQIAG